MSEPKDGGPAFPKVVGIKDGYQIVHFVETIGGMTLRDWFAGQVLVGMFAGREHGTNGAGATWARDAYRMADAMLAARSGGE